MAHAKRAEWDPRVIEGSHSTEPATIEGLRVDELIVPPEYQRTLDDAWVRFLISRYDASRVLVIVVSRRGDGTLVIVDGQHRVAMLRALGVMVIRALVYVGLSPIEEANLFEDLNRNRRAPNIFDLFRAQIAGNRPDALAIRALVAEFGYEFRRGGASAPNAIQAVGAVEAIYRQGGSDLLRAVLAITSGPWAEHSEGVEGQMLRGLAMFLRADMGHPVDVARLHHVLSRCPPIAILADARGIAVATGRAGATNGYMPYVLAIQKVYNTGLGSTSRFRLGAPRLNDRTLPARGRVGKTR